MSEPLENILQFPEKLQCLFKPKRYKVLHGGRGGTKSWGAARALLIQGLDGTQRVLCGRELQGSIKESVHKLLADQISKMGMNYLYEVQQQGIYGRESAKGTEFTFEGIRHNTAKIKSYEGLTRCWIEEADTLSEESFDIIRNTLRTDGSELWFTFNPRLEDDFIYQRFCVGKPPANAFVVEINWRDNPWFPAELQAEMEEDRERNYDKYLHIWEGKIRVALEGAVFADELREATAQKRICHVPFDRAFPVNVHFDLGYSDQTSIWFTQQVGFEYHVIDFYQNRLKHIDHYIQVMQQRGYTYGLIWLPHDAKAKTPGTRMSIQEQVAEVFGWPMTKLVPKLSVADKLNAARTVFPNCYFDEAKCKEGLRSLKHYRYKVDSPGNERLGIPPKYSKEPLHDWASDAADAFQYFAIASKQRVKAPKLALNPPRLALRLQDLGGEILGTGAGAPGTGWLGR